MKFLPRRFYLPEYRFGKPYILSAEVFFLEKRREGTAGVFLLSAALIAAAMVLWLLWMMNVKRSPDAPLKSAMLVCADREDTANG